MHFQNGFAQSAHFFSIILCIVFLSLTDFSPAQTAGDDGRAPEYQTPTINGRYRLRPLWKIHATSLFTIKKDSRKRCLTTAIQPTLSTSTCSDNLTESDNLTVNIDYGQMGVGGDNSWTEKALPLEKYRLNERSIKWTIKLSAQ